MELANSPGAPKLEESGSYSTRPSRWLTPPWCMMKYLAPSLLSLPFCVFGVVMLAIGAWHVFHGWASSNWSTTPGHIVSSRIRVDDCWGEDCDTAYFTEIRYDYMIQGQLYEGETIRFGPNTAYLRRSEAQSVLDQYPVGRQVQVAYDPAEPRLSVIERGLHLWTWMCGGMGVLFLVGGMTLFWGLTKRST